MRFQESVLNGLLDRELGFYSDKAWFTLNGLNVAKITGNGAQKLLKLFMKSIE
jgi:hypothetical protein